MASALIVAYGLRAQRRTPLLAVRPRRGTLSWVALYRGGLHPALALVPIVPFMPHAARDPGLFVEAPAGARDALSQFERHWKYPGPGDPVSVRPGERGRPDRSVRHGDVGGVDRDSRGQADWHRHRRRARRSPPD